ncbi:hypothetical protein [Fimbriimonas ginsengisoli]|uniref:Lipoprotein n=1 Tax=Fimbriimonas ginsengisoli Gsoil 348 TaxID=661478 RepID=A0A068NTU2_FIMGI|nr:hypothetical protein [Fimbriimonas ginsengisoli]AIE86175.1 hypothetical protein OP10G_2807 [Fimbriimonas ginsengisoli Gsoil 348]
MRTRIHAIGILAVIALSTVAFAAVDGFSVARKAKKDEVHKYSMKADVDYSGVPVVVNATISEKVTDVAADGAYTLEQMQVDGKVTINGSTSDMPGGPPTSMIYKANGEVSKILGDKAQATGGAYRMANLGLLVDPGKALAVGDAWTFDVKADKTLGTVAAKADFKLLGEEKIGTHDTLKVKATVKETEGDAPATSDGTMWIDKADGSMIKTEVKWTNAPFPGSPAPLNATVKIERVDK